MSGLRTGHSGYLQRLYNPAILRETIEAAAAQARAILAEHPFDAIAFRGSSGSALAFPLSAALQVPALQVRKHTESSHGRPIEGPYGEVHRYLIVDDMISSGATVCAIAQELVPARCAAILLYEDRYIWPKNLFPYDVPVYGLAGFACALVAWDEIEAEPPARTTTQVVNLNEDWLRALEKPELYVTPAPYTVSDKPSRNPAYRQLKSSGTYKAG